MVQSSTVIIIRNKNERSLIPAIKLISIYFFCRRAWNPVYWLLLELRTRLWWRDESISNKQLSNRISAQEEGWMKAINENKFNENEFIWINAAAIKPPPFFHSTFNLLPHAELSGIKSWNWYRSFNAASFILLLISETESNKLNWKGLIYVFRERIL